MTTDFALAPLGVASSAATISTCGRYRYLLQRAWENALPRVCFVMLNPSTADALTDDQTIRKCITFAKSWGFGSLEVANLFAWRATDPSELVRECRACDSVREHPIQKTGYERITGGRDGDDAILDAASRAQVVVAAWGVIPYVHRELKARPTQIEDMLRYTSGRLHAIRVTKHRYPAHPLYLPGNLVPVLYREARS